MSNKVYGIIEKRMGETTLESVERFRMQEEIEAGVPLAFAGRLDPLATGTVVVLIGEGCKEREMFNSLDKEYVVEVLLDIGTDTGDCMGMPTFSECELFDIAKIESVCSGLVGTHDWPYPAFSSRTVNGKPLFAWAAEGRISEIEIPLREMTIYNMGVDAQNTYTTAELWRRVTDAITSIPPVTDPSKLHLRDFRRADIIPAYLSLLGPLQAHVWQVVTITVSCASGAYMRSLAGVIGERLGGQALALSIHRSKVTIE